MNEVVLAWVWPACRAAAMITVAWYGARWLRRPLDRALHGRVDPTIQAFLVTALRPVLVLLALPPALDALHVSMSSALAVLSTAGLAIALALRDSLSNVASGGLLLTARPFRVGDEVTVAGVHGKVRRIGLLLLEIDTEDGRRVSITNDKVLAAPMERHAAEGRARLELVVRVPAPLVSADLLASLTRAVEGGFTGPVEVAPYEVETGWVRIAVRAWSRPEELARDRARMFSAIWPVVSAPHDGPATLPQHR